MTDTRTMKGHELFRSLRFEDVDRINSFSGVKRMGRGEVVYEGGSLGTHLYVLLEGAIEIRLPAKGAEARLSVGRIEKGELFGMSPLIGAGRHLATAVCSEPSTVLSIEAAPLRDLLHNEPATGLHVMSVAAQAYFSRYIQTLKRVQKVINELVAS